MAALLLGAWLAAAVVAAVPPTVTIYTNKSNVYGKAQPRADAGNVKYLGNESSTAGCEAACLAYAGVDGSECNSFSFHAVNFPDKPGTPPAKTFAGACYGITDHGWFPRDGSCPGIESCVTSGQVHRPLPACGSGSPAGCSWLDDPVCLALNGAHHCGRPGAPACISGVLEPAVMMTVAQAATKCAALPTCTGFTYDGQNASDSLVNITLANVTASTAGPCWTHRKFFAIDEDPYRPAFHFLPSSSWMNDPNGPMFNGGLYHLFWQWDPTPGYSIFPVSAGGFNNMHWGHGEYCTATLIDLIYLNLCETVGHSCFAGYNRLEAAADCALPRQRLVRWRVERLRHHQRPHRSRPFVLCAVQFLLRTGHPRRSY
jgi:hypothetical protein